LEAPVYGIYESIQEDVAILSNKKMYGEDAKKWGDVHDNTTLWLIAIERGARSDTGYAQIWANYTGHGVTVDQIWDEPSQTMRGRLDKIDVHPDPEYVR
jgi:hypothetical protein